MKPRTLNLTTIFLSCAGLFVAGSLSLSKVLDVSLPCGAAHSCDEVTTSKWGVLFGLPVAYLGFLGYAFLLLLGILRIKALGDKFQKLVYAGYAYSLLGMVFSLFLQYQSITEVHQICPWCVTSAAIMVILFFVHAFLATKLPSEEDSKGQFKFGALFLGLAAVGVAVNGFALLRTEKGFSRINLSGVPIAEYMPDKDHLQGPADAKLTIIEFADLHCPACKEDYPKIREQLGKVKGKIQFGFRHFPLINMHPGAATAAMISEMCAEQGKFFEYVAAIYKVEDPKNLTTGQMIAIADSLNVDTKKFNERLAKPDNDPAYLKVQRDMDFGVKIKLIGTPTIIAVLDGRKVNALSFKQLPAYFNQDDVLDLIGNR